MSTIMVRYTAKPERAQDDGPADRLMEPIWIEPYPDTADALDAPAARYEVRESVELAFIAALQHLPARQRAVLILRDVLGFSAREVAHTLDTTPVAVDSALQRAHRSVEQRLPARSQQTTLRALGDKRLSELVGGYVDAWERGDVDALVAMLTQDARVTMPPIPTWYRGRDAVGVFLAGHVLGSDRPRRLLPVIANGQPAFGQYRWNDAQRRLQAYAITVLTLDGDKIQEITAFLDPAPFARFGLPAEL